MPKESGTSRYLYSCKTTRTYLFYAKAVIDQLGKQGINARIEKEYQELLAQECVQLIVDFFKLAATEKTHDSWVRVSEVLSFIQGFDFDRDHPKILKMESELNEHISQIRRKLFQVESDEKGCKKIIEDVIKGIFSFIGTEKYFRLYPKYARGAFFNKLIDNSVVKISTAYYKYMNWRDAISDFLGLFSIPIMTIHKSKGLEYDTVIFLGLEDDAFWSFQKQSFEDMCAFFVALSRAKNQCFFTFSASREVLHFGDVHVRSQFSQNISPLYEILRKANVEVRNIAEVSLDDDVYQ
jgi:DNA helicase-2/ATP-dependent DNA helicase PcrA